MRNTRGLPLTEPQCSNQAPTVRSLCLQRDVQNRRSVTYSELKEAHLFGCSNRHHGEARIRTQTFVRRGPPACCEFWRQLSTTGEMLLQGSVFSSPVEGTHGIHTFCKYFFFPFLAKTVILSAVSFPTYLKFQIHSKLFRPYSGLPAVWYRIKE